MTLRICDIAAGDGLRAAGAALEPAMRAELVDRLAAAGVPRIEIASVGPGREAAEAEYVAGAFRPREHVAYAARVDDLAGYGHVRDATLAEVRVAVPATETLAARRGRTSVAAALADLAAVAAAAQDDGRRVGAEILGAFGCPFEGEVDGFAVFDVAVRAVGAGADELVLVDSAAAATPSPVTRLVRRCETTRVPVGVQLSDARSTAVACALAAVEAGARVLDGAVGGLAGPERPGLVATEDLVYALEREGVDTGIDLSWLVDVAVWLAGEIGRPLPGRVHRAGAFPPC